MNGLLSSVRKYPIGAKDPKENFLTEAWVWILQRFPDFAEHFMRRVLPTQITSSLNEIAWETQVSFDNHGRPDVVAIGDSWVVVFEHKTSSTFRPDQIEDYSSGARIKYPDKNTFVVAISGQKSDQKSADAEFIWSDIAAWIAEYLENPTPVTDEEATIRSFLLNDFVIFLTNEGFGPMLPIKPLVLKNYLLHTAVEPSTRQLFMAAMHKYASNDGWEAVYKKISGVKLPLEHASPRMPNLTKKISGRLGIEFIE